MKKTFREYYKFSEDEYKQLWKDCLFIFDTNALLNMYRYSRATVSSYIAVLKELKKQNRIWIPYQVGFEFHENRINVISEFEKSYDDILKIIDDAKEDIRNKYKDHPFLDLGELTKNMDVSLNAVQSEIKRKKGEHPKWIDNDDVLEQLNVIFNGSVGGNYDEARLDEIKKEGVKRYEKNIAPGFKDKSKPEEKRYGDLLLWYQIIDKARETKKPVVFVSGDIKEDWWLEKDGKKICPLPQLKKEMLTKAGVDFHIYTADKFLEYANDLFKGTKINPESIKEVRRIREIDEKRVSNQEQSVHHSQLRFLERFTQDFLKVQEMSFEMVNTLKKGNLNPKHIDEFVHLLHRLRLIAIGIRHGNDNKVSMLSLLKVLEEMQEFIQHTNIYDMDLETINKIRGYQERLESWQMRIRRYF